MAAPRLLTVGSIAYDVVETPYHPATEQLGGSAVFVSLAASVLVPTAVIGVVGQDFAEQDIALLQSKGVDTSGVVRVPGETFRWSGRYDAQLKERETIFTRLGVFAEFSPVIPVPLKGLPFLFLGNIDPKLQLAVLDSVEKPIWVGCDTMNYWISSAREDLLRLLKRVDGLFLNDSEAEQLTGHQNVSKAARAIQALGPTTVIIKRGEFGAMVFSGGRSFTLPAFPLEDVRDPTGAGDSFAGGFMAQLASSADVSPVSIQKAAAVGTVTASFCVEDFGPYPLARLDLARLQARLASYREMVSLPEITLP